MDVRELLEQSYQIPKIEYEHDIYNVFKATFSRVFTNITDDVFLLYEINVGDILNNELTFVDLFSLGKLIYTKNEPKPFLIQDSIKVLEYRDVSGGFVSMWLDKDIKERCTILYKPKESNFFGSIANEGKKKNELDKKYKW